MKKFNFLGLLLIILVVFFSAFGLIKLAGRGEVKPEEKTAVSKLPVRQPAVAGGFYSTDPVELANQIESFLKPVLAVEKRPMILIVPHAGYQYSGQVAADGFGQLTDSGIKRVILIGSSHQASFKGAAVFEKGVWQTPLGKVQVNKILAEAIIQASPLVFANEAYHQNEHSLEVEIPFLQTVLIDYTIVPILMGSQEEELIESLAAAIVPQLDSETLLLVSTDLAHYPNYQDAKMVDEKTIGAILSGETKAFETAITESLATKIPGLSTCACGEAAVKVGLKVAKKLAVGDIRLLNYANSGDVTGDQNRIVGYASIGFYSDRIGTQLNLEEQEELLTIARKTLEVFLKDQTVPEFEIKHPFLNQPLGAFVTLKREERLRGCIGQFEPEVPLWQVVRQKAIDAAVHDRRFPPVSETELEEIKIEISVLSPQKKIVDWQEIELGKHGVVIKKGVRSGVFLPQVATDNDWDLDKFMGELCSQKAGLERDCWKSNEVDLFTFTAQVFEEE